MEILDVGGHSSSLKLFLPTDRVVLSDPKEPPDCTHREEIPFRYDAYVQSLGGKLPFKDRSFDLVTAHDTLEHVPDRFKAPFVEDLLRVSRRFVILNGPMRDPWTLEAERRMVRYWRRGLSWTEHPLQEHMDSRLPTHELVQSVLRKNSALYTTIPNGDISLWLFMFALKSYLLTLPDPRALDEVTDRVYNTLVTPNDQRGACYRAAYVIAKTKRDAPSIRRVAARFPKRQASLRQPVVDVRLRDALVGTLEQHAREIRNTWDELRSTVAALRKMVDDKESALHDKDALLVMKDAALGIKDAAIAEREIEIISRDRELSSRRVQVAEKDSVIAERNALLARKDELLAQREHAFGDLVGEMTTIKSSVSYRFSSGLSRRIRRMMPPGTWRGRVLESIARGVRRLLDRRLRRRGLAPPREEAVPKEADAYATWIQEFEPHPPDVESQTRRARMLAYRPVISIVMPVWNPPLEALREAVASVQRQTYDRWELCIADGGSRDDVRSFLTELTEADERVRVRLLEGNLGISGNTNEAVAVASGEYVAFLDHTDTLAPFALFEVAALLNRDPTVDVAYSDFDLIAADGRRFNPFFTPTWSPELLLSANYMAHLSVIRRRLVNEAGGLRPEMDGAQDWDLLLRVTESTDRVARIPAILYHWRSDETSAALSLDEKPYALDAQEAAVRQHLERLDRRGTVERTESGALRIRWKARDRPAISVIIPTKHNRVLLERCLRGLAESDYPKEIIVVETAGRDSDKERWYDEMQRVVDLRVHWWQGPFNYSAVNNMAADHARGEFLLFLNDDTEPFAPGWLEEMVGWVAQEDIGIVGAQLIGFDGSIQHGGVVIGIGGFADHLFKGARPGQWTLMGSTMWYRNVSAVTGACLMMRKDVLERVGGWDESFELCGSDVELGLRVARSGYRVVCSPFAPVRHLEAATRGGYVPPADFATSYWHYQRYLHGGDPFFNPNLSPVHPVPTLRTADDVTAAHVVSNVIGRNLVPKGPSDPIAEAVGFSERLQATAEDVEGVRRLHEESRDLREVGSINWLIPDFESPFYGGIHTILRFAHHFQDRYGVKNRFVVIGTGPEDYIRTGIRAAFSSLGDASIHLCPSATDEELDDVPDADASIATLWVTAYPLLRLRGTRRKFYFIQDYEPSFYPAGTVQALAEQTYRMGFYGIANTPTLKEIYVSQYGGTAVSFMPCVDELFHPNGEAASEEPYTVFYYGRPGHPRNCYELAMGALHRVKRELKDRVRIVTAGSWAPRSEGLDSDFVEHHGLLGYEETAGLYRHCDAGLVLSVSKHPSYLPMQLMASGCLVVGNVNPAGSWLLRDGKNSLLAPPTAEALFESLKQGLSDGDLRRRLTSQAVTDIRQRFTDWDAQIERVYRFVSNPEG